MMMPTNSISRKSVKKTTPKSLFASLSISLHFNLGHQAGHLFGYLTIIFYYIAKARPALISYRGMIDSYRFWKGGESLLSFGQGRKVRTPQGAMPRNLCLEQGIHAGGRLKTSDGQCHRK